MSVRVRELSKSFGRGAKRQEVLKGVDIDVQHGEVVGLIGPNGAGKTTLMSCILAFLTPSGGEVSIEGRPPDDLVIRRRTGFVPERMHFDRNATCRQFLRYMGRLGGLSTVAAAARADDLLARLDMTGAASKRLSQCSRGMLQRVLMCQALLNDPDFLFLDEPTSGLDPNGVMLVREIIDEQRKRGTAVLLNSHQLAEVERLCDRVFFLDGGLIAERQTLRQATEIEMIIRLLNGSYDRERITAVAGVAPDGDVLRLTLPSEEEVARVVAELVQAGAGLVEVRRRAAELEQIFRRKA